MPRIWNEALDLKKTFIINGGGAMISKNLSVKKAVLCNMRSNNIFQFSYFQVRQHLFNDHKIFHILDDEMIDIVFDGLIDPGSSNNFVLPDCVKAYVLLVIIFGYWMEL
ncbi:19848_t:CDS:2 [Gigaspora rosea]|nr:19848_t:CDS:2 [Gigaspora rosea]